MQTELATQTQDNSVPPVPKELEAEHAEELRELLLGSDEVRGTKNLNEHLNCTKQECGSPWR